MLLFQNKMTHSHYFIIVLSTIVALTTSFNHPCTSEDLSGCLLGSVKAAQRINSREISIILLPHIRYVLNNSFKVDGEYSLFEIIGNGTSRVKIDRQNDSSLVFLNINQIKLRKLSFGEDEETHPQEKFYPFLSINNSESININNCKFDRIQGNALSIYVRDLDKDFYLLIENSNFFGTGKPERPSQGIYIQLQNTSNANVTVTNCRFRDLKINNSTSLKVLTGHQRMLYRPLAFEQSYNVNSDFHKSFTLSHSKFENNDAYVGGGFGVYTSNACNSSYYITHCNFKSNRVVRQFLRKVKSGVDVSGSGGGIAALLFDCENCNLSVSHCAFSYNHAALGGGVKVGYYFNSPRVNINIKQSSFLHNRANSGSGLYIEAQLVQPAIPEQAILCNLDFSNNVAYDFGAGIFVAYLPLRLEGDGMTFLNNINTSFSVISSQIEVYTKLNFTNNNGSRGGALFLSDNSQLLLDQNVDLYFVKNRASDKGGAIYADSISLDLLYRNYGYTFYNVHCFIKHFIKFNTSTPDNYTQNIYFQYNEAPVGSAIYTHTLSPCSWYSNVTPYSAIDKALRWPTYHYESKDPNKHDIATAVAHYHISQYEDSKKNSTHPVTDREPTKLKVVPGQSSQINFKATDQLNYSDVSIATVQPDDNSQVSPCNGQGDGSIFLTSSSTEPVEVMFCGRPGTTGKVSFKALDGLTIENIILVHLKECPKGEFWNETDKSCDKYHISGYDVPSLWKCNVNTSLIRVPGLMRKGNNDTFVSITCPTTYCEHSDQNNSKKIDCSHEALGEKCVSGRVGIGCSSCAPGKQMRSGSLICTKNCDFKTTTITTVFLIILLLVLISVLFLIRSSSYLDSHIHLRETLFPYARSFIFFCQGTFILYLNTFDKKEKNLSNFITKTGFFFTYDLCFSLGFTDTRGRVFEEYFFYLIGFVAILLLALLVNCVVARFLPIRFKYSVISYAFVSYSFLTFTPIAFTTLRLLSCGTLTTYSSTSGVLSDSYQIWYYDSTQSCYGTHADILITSTAFLVLFLYIIPLPVTYFLLALNGERRKMKGRLAAIPPKFKSLFKILNATSTEYLSSFPKSSFGFWIPTTMLSYLTLLIIQTNGPLFKIESDNQAQLMAVICFFFLYIRVSLKISDDIFVQLYDAISIFFLCISCIFLIIYADDKYSSHLFESLIKYFPLIAYVILFLAILLFPIIKYFWTKQKNVAAENEDKKENSVHNSIMISIRPEDRDDDEADDLDAPLLRHDHLEDSNHAMPVSPPFQRDPSRPISINESYPSSPYHSSGTPGDHDSALDVDLSSLELSDHAQMRD